VNAKKSSAYNSALVCEVLH